MCLGIPGRIEAINSNQTHLRMGTVSFGSLKKEVCLAYTPEAAVGEYVIVHAGFAISIVDAEQAERVFRYLEEIEAERL